MLDWLVKLRLIDARNIISFVLDEADVMISQEGYQTTSIQIHKLFFEQKFRQMFINLQVF